MPQSGLKLYGIGTRTLKVQLVAAFSNVELEKMPFTRGVTNKTPRYLAMNPQGKVPSFLLDLARILCVMPLSVHAETFYVSYLVCLLPALPFSFLRNRPSMARGWLHKLTLHVRSEQ